MKSVLPPLLLLPLLVACPEDEPNDGGADVTHVAGEWRLDWSCTRDAMTVEGCSIVTIYQRGGGAAEDVYAVVWDSLNGEGAVMSNQLSVDFEDAVPGSPTFYLHSALLTFRRDDEDVFSLSSTYQPPGPSGGCTGNATRVPEGTAVCD